MPGSQPRSYAAIVASVTHHLEVVLQVRRHENVRRQEMRGVDDENRKLMELLAESTTDNATLMEMLTIGFPRQVTENSKPDAP